MWINDYGQAKVKSRTCMIKYCNLIEENKSTVIMGLLSRHPPQHLTVTHKVTTP